MEQSESGVDGRSEGAADTSALGVRPRTDEASSQGTRLPIADLLSRHGVAGSEIWGAPYVATDWQQPGGIETDLADQDGTST